MVHYNVSNSRMIFILRLLISFLLYTHLPHDSSFASRIYRLRPHIVDKAAVNSKVFKTTFSFLSASMYFEESNLIQAFV